MWYPYFTYNVKQLNNSWLYFCSRQPSWKQHQTGRGGSVQTWVQSPWPGGQMDQWWVIHYIHCTCWNSERFLLIPSATDGLKWIKNAGYIGHLPGGDIYFYEGISIRLQWGFIVFLITDKAVIRLYCMPVPWIDKISTHVASLLLNYTITWVTAW